MTKINCLIVDDESTARDILEIYIGHVEALNLVKSCSNAQEAFEMLDQNSIDLIFLDINMPGISGITLAKALKGDVSIIFTTAYREYAVEGFDLQAVDYLVKPIAPERFHQAVSKFLKEQSAATEQGGEDEFVTIRSDRKTIRLKREDIRFVESFGDYLKVHTESKTCITRETISSLVDRLPSKLFLRIHRSFLINVEHIEAFTKESIEIAGQGLPISRTYKSNVFDQLNARND